MYNSELDDMERFVRLKRLAKVPLILTVLSYGICFVILAVLFFSKTSSSESVNWNALITISGTVVGMGISVILSLVAWVFALVMTIVVLCRKEYSLLKFTLAALLLDFVLPVLGAGMM